ncbi:MAG: hypothetical protein Q9190_004461 [Brigantiaea leucoxantha]
MPSLSTQPIAPTHGSSTQLETDPRIIHAVGTLRLQGVPPQSDSRRIRWADDVVDNEGMGKKKSKDSDSDNDSGEGGNDDGRARVAGSGPSRSSKSKGRRTKGHEHGNDCGHSGHGAEGSQRPNSRRRNAVNAYEKEPRRGRKPPTKS